MRLKDHYKTLEVFPTASPQEIKKSYRKLAFKYHPDQNPTNSFAEAHFREISEAYEVLSHPAKRRKYDEERWLSGMSNHMEHQQAITPQWILNECIKLSKHMATIDTYRMSHGSLRDYILQLLSDSHMAILQEHKDDETNKEIIYQLLNATSKLQVRYFDDIEHRLAQLAGTDNELLSTINETIKERKRQAGRNQYIPLIVIIITFLVCMLVYLYGKK
ncbi:MAG TPA: DnaJ domain-containing protein [Flavipsychrobacter sp.]|nr:DnaJ domain-containing protein [Flavipsychrobacter sp.]